MTAQLLTVPTRYWQCPSCGTKTSSTDPKVVVAMHPCPALAITVPMVEVVWDKDVDTNQVRHVIKHREDYVGNDDGLINRHGEKVLDDNGNWLGALPRDNANQIVMAVETERADGSNDLNVFAPASRRTED